MGWLSRYRAVADAATGDVAPVFEAPVIGPDSVPPMFAGLSSYADYTAPAPRVTRREAMQVPAVKRARDLIAGTIGTIPFGVLDTQNIGQVSGLLSQPERNVARSVTMTRLVEDLLFESVAWWRVVERDWRDYPAKVVRLLPRSVNQQPDGKNYVARDGSSQGQSWEYVEARDLIRFDSPTDGLLDAGARAIRTALKLDTAAARYADEPMPTGYFEPRDGAADPAGDDDVTTLLDDWETARRTHSTAYIPAALRYNTVQWSAQDIQLADARQHAVLEIARLVGIDPEDLGVSTTSRTYQNGQDRRIAMINDVLGMYVSAVAERLSMGDITARGYRVIADFNGFLRADDKTRFETYQLGITMGLFDAKAVASREGLPEPAEPAPTPEPAPSVEAHMPTEILSFDSGPSVFGFATDGNRKSFEVDREKRTITGLAVPYGVSAQNQGRLYQFSRGSLVLPKDPTRVKLLIQHDRSQAVGKAVELTETDAGLMVKFQVARGSMGDRALEMAEDGVWDGLSIGLRSGGRFSENSGVHHSVRNELAEISLTPDPAFSDARVSGVTAEADQKGTAHMGDEITEPSTETAPTFDMAALVAALGEQFELKPKETQNGPEVITPSTGAGFEIDEALPYAFENDRGFLSGGEHDFSADLRAASNGDFAANQRVLGFMSEALDFAVTTSNTASLNPSRQRPDLYVDQRQYQYPLWAAVRKESLSDVTPIVLPKYSSHSGLVAAHTEGTEPTPGAFTATSQTITPGAMSGKAEITRELWDQAGNPRVSNLIWQKMLMGWFEALEAKVVTTLTAAAASITDITLTTGGGTGGATASAELASAFAALQYARGGFAFDTLAAQIDLYQRLATAVTTTGEPLFPQISPNNRNGSSSPRYAAMSVHGVDVFPEWALAATGIVAASSWLFDRESIWAAASTPDRLEWNFGATVQTSNLTQIANVTIGIWGYAAAAVLDTTGVREIVYDPV